MFGVNNYWFLEAWCVVPHRPEAACRKSHLHCDHCTGRTLNTKNCHYPWKSKGHLKPTEHVTQIEKRAYQNPFLNSSRSNAHGCRVWALHNIACSKSSPRIVHGSRYKKVFSDCLERYCWHRSLGKSVFIGHYALESIFSFLRIRIPTWTERSLADAARRLSLFVPFVFCQLLNSTDSNSST